jgi:hypothetical protein
MNNIKQINNKSYQECDVVMLETSKTNNLNDIVLNPDKTKLATLNPLTIDSKQPCTNQHLYILSNDEIKEGDWCISMNLAYKKPFQCTNLLYAKEYNCKKILATTDSSLIIGYKCLCYGSGSIGCNFENNKNNPVRKQSKCEQEKINLFKIPQSFIEQFITECNKGNINGISKPLVECYVTNETTGDKFLNFKINNKNEISILTEQKQSYSREEVEALLYNLPFDIDLHYGENSLKNWIKDNL